MSNIARNIDSGLSGQPSDNLDRQRGPAEGSSLDRQRGPAEGSNLESQFNNQGAAPKSMQGGNLQSGQEQGSQRGNNQKQGDRIY